MYSNAFCKVYNEFGWNYFPEAFGEQLMEWIRQNQVEIQNSLDLGCGTGILCEVLQKNGICASGMDFSEGMIEIARKSNPEIPYEVADMVTYHPQKKFDLVTCTGDALNHILAMEDVGRIFENVYDYLNNGGYFIFDILNEKEVALGEPIDLDFSETVKAQFMITQNQEGVIDLQITVWEEGKVTFEEHITEIVHDKEQICALLEKAGFQVQSCSHKLLENSEGQGNTWFVIAKK